MKIGIIIQARNGSTRLPKKVTLPFYNNQSILEIILIKLKKLSLPIVIATTTNPEDDNISLIAKRAVLLPWFPSGLTKKANKRKLKLISQKPPT